MIENELIDIIIAPHDKPYDELTQKVAIILNQDLYHARMLLSSKYPRIIAQTADINRAKDIISKMDTLGVVSFLFKNTELHKPLRLFKVSSLEFSGHNIIFKDKNNQIFSLEGDNILLILKGILKTTKIEEVTRKVKKLNFTATLLTGGIPIGKTIKQRTSESTITYEGFIRVLGRNTMDPCLEIRQYSFDYSCLETDMSTSSLQNINLIARKMAERFPSAVFEDKSNRLLSHNSAPNYSDENIDIESKLTYLYYHKIKSNNPG
jgi:hypothetical protein